MRAYCRRRLAYSRSTNSVELPAGYENASVISPAELEQAQAGLLANPVT